MPSDSERVLRLKTTRDDLILVPRGLTHDWKLGDPVSPIMFTAYTRQWFARTLDNRLLKRFMEANQIASSGTDEQAMAELERALREGRILVFQVKRRTVIVPLESGVEPLGPAPDDDPAEPLTWIAFEVVDPDGDPVAGRSFVLTLPDGSTRDGQLDEAGKAKMNRIPPGNCKFSLVDVDQREVKFVSSGA